MDKFKKLIDYIDGEGKSDESVVTESLGEDDLFDYYLHAEELFFDRVAKEIKKIARDHAENVEVTRTRNIVYLGYKGQDLSDIDFDFVVNIVSGGDVTEVKFIVTKLGKESIEYVKKPIREVTVQFIVNMFNEYFK